MNLHECILTKNECYSKGRKMSGPPIGIMVHSTGANNPNLKRYVQPDDGLLGVNTSGTAWNQPRPDGRQVCPHAFIGLLGDGTTVATYQTLPWEWRGWHSGSGKKGTCNDRYIGFEICEDSLADSIYFSKVYQEAVDLCVYLCQKFSLTEVNIICHSEGYKMGMASNHADVMHWFPKHGKSMDTFRADVKTRLSTTDRPEVEGTKTYTLHTALPGYVTASDALKGSNQKNTMKPGTYYVYNITEGGAVNITSKEGVPGSWINGNLNKETVKADLFRVRTSWENPKSQIGAYSLLSNAKNQANQYKNQGYKVYNSAGMVVYDPNNTSCPTCGRPYE